MNSRFVPFFSLACAALTGCGGADLTIDGDDFALDPGETTLHAQASSTVLGLRIRGFEPLAPGWVYESVEPQPDDSPAPFALKPLSDRVDDRGAGMLQSLTNTSANTIQRGFVTLY